MRVSLKASNTLKKMRTHQTMGLPVPTRTRGRMIKKIISRLTWFMHRDQLDFNDAVIQHLEELNRHVELLREQIDKELSETREQIEYILSTQNERLKDFESEIIEHQHRVGSSLARLEASLRSEFSALETRQLHTENELMSIQASVIATQQVLQSAKHES